MPILSWFHLPIHDLVGIIWVIIVWFHHQITPCLIITSILINCVVVMDHLPMHLHPLGDLYLGKLCSHFQFYFLLKAETFQIVNKLMILTFCTCHISSFLFLIFVFLKHLIWSHSIVLVQLVLSLLRQSILANSLLFIFEVGITNYFQIK